MKRVSQLMGGILLSIVLLGNHAIAATLDLVPSSQTVKLGSEVTVYLHVSGFDPGVTPVAYFDIDIVYGDSDQILKFKKAVFGPQLGNPSDPSEITAIGVTEYDGFLWVVEKSLLPQADLGRLQYSGAVTLVALKFKAKHVGDAIISGDLYILEDQFGNKLVNEQGRVGSAAIKVVKGERNLPPSFPNNSRRGEQDRGADLAD